MKFYYILLCFLVFNLTPLNLNGQCPEVVDAGTVTVNDNGGGNVPFVVCFGSSVDMTSDGNYILPTTGPFPRLMYAMYTCAPTDLIDPGADLCFDGSYFTDESFQGVNDGSVVAFLGQNTFWMVPIAADNGLAPPNGPNHDSNGDLCFDINLDQVQMWTFLDEIICTPGPADQCTGEATFQIVGGYEEIFGGNYSLTNTGPGLISQLGATGEDVTVSGLLDGETPSFDIEDSNGCIISFSGTPIDVEDITPSISYPDICVNGSALPSTIDPLGGTFSFTVPPGDGSTIDPNTGEISNANGNYDITYTYVGICGPYTTNFIIGLLPPISLPIVDNSYEFCESDNAFITPNGIGDIYSLYADNNTLIPLETGFSFDMAFYVAAGTGAITFFVSQTVNNCESNRVSFTVEIFEETPPMVISSIDVCEGNTVTITPTTTHNSPNPSFNFYEDAGLSNLIINAEEYTFTPVGNTSIYVTELFNICESRPAPVDIFVEPLPSGVAGAPVCEANNQFYSVIITSNASSMTSSSGSVTDNTDGTFTISGIPSGNTLDITMSSAPVVCTNMLSLPVFQCSCNEPNPPTNPINQVICTGTGIPPLSVTVDAGIMVDWYDAALGGTLLLSNSNSFTPLTAGIYYAEARNPIDGCVNANRIPVTLTINTLPTLVSAPVTCAADLLTYEVTFQITNGVTLQVSAGIISGNNGNFVVSSIPVGTDLTYSVSNADNSCTLGPLDIISPNCPCPSIDPPTTLDISICAGDAIPELTAGVLAGQTVDWYDSMTDGILLLGDNINFTPIAAGIYYAEAKNTTNNCVSTRVAVTIASNPLPSFTLDLASCAADLLTYELNISTTETDIVISTLGNVVDNGGGSFTITNIPSENDISIELTNSTTSCESTFPISAPDCNCGVVSPPVSLGDSLICTGNTIPALEVSVNPNETVDWYDAAIDGILISQNSSIYTPTLAGTYYAETRVISDDCISSIRTAVTLSIVPSPTIVSTESICALNLLSYQVVIITTNGASIEVSAGITSINNDTITITNIPSGMDLSYTVFNTGMSCSVGPENIPAPDCTCPLVNPPTVMDIAICEGDSIPTLDVDVSVGATADWYDADDGTLLLSSHTSFTPTQAGTYLVEARNTTNNCVSIRVPVTITNNPLPSFIVNDLNCTLDLSSYSIDLSSLETDNVLSNLGNIIDNGSGNYVITNIPSGDDINLTLSNSLTGCLDTFSIEAPDCTCGPLPAPINLGDHTICTGDLLPALEVSVETGETVDWYDLASDGALLLSNSSTFTPLEAGTYYAETRTITNGCLSINRTAVTLNIETTPSLISTTPTCSLDLLSYEVQLQIDNASSLETDVGTIVNNGDGNFTIQGVPIGTELNYTAFNNGINCSFGPITIASPNCPCPIISPPTVIALSFCTGDEVPTLEALTTIGVTTDWYDAITEGNLLLGDNQYFTPVDSGTYFVEARNIINNCISARIETKITRNPLPTFTIINTTCSPDLLTYEVNISTTVTDIASSTLGDIIDNGDGTYTIQSVPSENNFELNLTNSVTQCNQTFNITAPDCSCGTIALPTSLGNKTICTGETIPSLDAAGGTNETIDWYDAATGGNLLIPNATSYTPTQAGTYYAEVRNTINGCISSERLPVSLIINANPTLSVSSFNIPDCNSNNGSITLEVLNGISPYTYWVNNNEQQESNIITLLATGDYNLFVEDDNGCTGTISQTLTSPDEVFAVAGEDMTLTCTNTSITLDASESDAGQNIVYQWLDSNEELIVGATSMMLTTEIAGTYTIMVTNTENLCTDSDQVTITTNNSLPVINVSEQQNIDCINTSASISVEIDPTEPLTLEWTTSQGGSILGSINTTSIIASTPGQYHITVVNTETGCPNNATVSVVEILPQTSDLNISIESPHCLGDENGLISISTAIGTPPLLYALNDGPFISTPIFSNLEQGEYTLHIEDENGCKKDTTLTVFPGTEISLDLGNDLFIKVGEQVILEGKTGPAEEDLSEIVWSNPQFLTCPNCLITSTLTLEESLIFGLEITDNLGCTASDEVRVFVDNRHQVFVPNAFSPNGDGHNDRLIVQGGADLQNISSFLIFDRWGNNVFAAENFPPNSMNDGWTGDNPTGKAYNSNVFIYQLEVEFITGKKEYYSGEVILIR